MNQLDQIYKFTQFHIFSTSKLHFVLISIYECSILDINNQINMYNQVIVACICERTIGELYEKAKKVSL